MNCPFCTADNGPKANFCSSCGSPLHLRVCLQCEAVNDKAMTACSNCGAPLPTVKNLLPESVAAPLVNRGRAREIIDVEADPNAVPEWERLLHNIEAEIRRLDARLPPGLLASQQVHGRPTDSRTAEAVPRMLFAAQGYPAQEATVIEPLAANRQAAARPEFDENHFNTVPLDPPRLNREQFNWTAPVLLLLSAVIAAYSYLSLPLEPLGPLPRSLSSASGKADNAMVNTLLAPGSLLVPDSLHAPDSLLTPGSLTPDAQARTASAAGTAHSPARDAIHPAERNQDAPATRAIDRIIPRADQPQASGDPLGELIEAKMPSTGPASASDPESDRRDTTAVRAAATPAAGPAIAQASQTGPSRPARAAAKSPRRNVTTHPAKQAELDLVRGHLY